MATCKTCGQEIPEEPARVDSQHDLPAQGMPVSHPPLRYHGAKWRISKWIIDMFPPHECYVEPFCGGAAVLFNKIPSQIEVINDLNSDVVTFFDVLRSQPDAFIRAIELTPFSREVQESAHRAVDDPFQKALNLYIRCWQSYGVPTGKYNSGWRFQRTDTRGSSILGEWNRTDHLWHIAERLKSVFIEHDDASRVIKRFDGSKTLFYIDPPYPIDVRTGNWAGKAYSDEMTDDDHRELAKLLHAVEGMVFLSGYQCPLYEELYSGWTRLEKTTTTNGNNQAIESLWLSPAAVAINRLPLFELLEKN